MRPGSPIPEVTLLIEAPNEQEALATVDDLLSKLTKAATAQPCQEQEQAGTEVTQVGPGVLRMQLPIALPGLGHVNAYALLDEWAAAQGIERG